VLVARLVETDVRTYRRSSNCSRSFVVAYTAGEIDIKAARQALQKSRNREVREFAQDMVPDESAANEQALALVKRSAPFERWRKSGKAVDIGTGPFRAC
jgi:hypothetical protein